MSPLCSDQMGKVETYSSISSLQQRLENAGAGKQIGFVPTMGALHAGHLSLVKRAHEECDVVVLSIFVNPTQFNNAEDLRNYPRNIERDMELLGQIKNDIIVFNPGEREIYPDNYAVEPIDLGKLDELLEGKFRPGHFTGVVEVVHRLFEIVKPNRAYFGLKDFQQVAIIRLMTKIFRLPVEIVPCEIVREESGLAMSSRNERLSEAQRNDALIIYQALNKAKEMIHSHEIAEITKTIEEMFRKSTLKLEYFAIVNPETLETLSSADKGAHACIAAHCGEVRLIDNMRLI